MPHNPDATSTSHLHRSRKLTKSRPPTSQTGSQLAIGPSSPRTRDHHWPKGIPRHANVRFSDYDEGYVGVYFRQPDDNHHSQRDGQNETAQVLSSLSRTKTYPSSPGGSSPLWIQRKPDFTKSPKERHSVPLRRSDFHVHKPLPPIPQDASRDSVITTSRDSAIGVPIASGPFIMEYLGDRGSKALFTTRSAMGDMNDIVEDSIPTSRCVSFTSLTERVDDEEGYLDEDSTTPTSSSTILSARRAEWDNNDDASHSVASPARPFVVAPNNLKGTIQGKRGPHVGDITGMERNGKLDSTRNNILSSNPRRR
ncbi:uncharacterized protein LAESUDRAFT_126425 [Laetiporus sulphureus 93-53]|uniref:Uncharacterized protein n=1 Tax=Laetiporus sulphureus 93-53 TaxID=1314785 RepID=A0A165EFW8_9APHY|nr:uncharacterized protein LAESUDRAFT_126425 [Laetiporus sulphureus 93-53]KZT06975.1 hypothetical protein LAESUDRAFT_126425 [Laetiporus sulphureus 93-53]